MGKKLTVFTPTYNRAYILPQLYRSLCAQNSQDFRWLIIDDGSSDGTGQIVTEWIAEAVLDIEYHFQQNAGKMAAYNFALSLTQTPLVMCVDSDDYLVPDAVDAIVSSARSLENSEKLSGIVAYKGDPSGNVLGTTFPESVSFSPLKGLYDLGFEGDTTLVFKTEIAKQYLFPILPGEKFISEMYVYNQIDKHYDMILLRKVLTICSYLEDGYTRNGYSLVKKNPMGWALIYHQKKEDSGSLRAQLKNAAFAGSYVLMASKAARKFALEQDLYHVGLTEVIASPASLLLFLRRKWVHRNE